MPTLLRLASPDPTPSVRTDYSSHTFKLHSEEDADDLFAYAMDLAEKILPTKERLEPSKGQYFQIKYLHPCGLSLEMTPLDSKLSTAGCALLVLPGAVWGSLDASERRDLIIDIRSWPGYYRTTRWDPQITVLDPPKTIYEIIDDVSKGRLWVARFSTEQSYERRDRNGLLIESPTQYFGSPQSNIRLRIYDHGAKHGWATPSLRVETQIRKEPADQHFNRLATRCKQEADAEPLLVLNEETSVKDALMQHAQFKDTTAWEGRKKPRKWAQTASEPAWWTEMLQHEGEPLAITHKPELDLDKTMAALKEQYGRKLFLWSRAVAACKGMPTSAVLEEFVLECGSQLKKGDEELLASLAPRGSKQACRDSVRRAMRYAAEKAEQCKDVGAPLPR
jgi:hypothetical protein